ncbi:MAG: endonuclease/exonuclease/phosphatase family protein [Prevotella sp.]|nr:endonuclease/exonuclease/phosphatase family protein [Prevotella sp.]
MARTFRKIFFWILLVFNVVVIALMLISGYSGYLSPKEHPLLSLSGLIFPLFLILNVLMLLVWFMVRKRMMLLPIAGLLLAYAPIRTYVPINLSTPPPEGSIKVLSFNVFLWAGWEYKKQGHNPIVDYLAASDADIICLQEASPHEYDARLIDEALNPLYPYRDSIMYRHDGDCLAIYSRFPILDSERISYSSRGNQSMASRLLIDGDTVLVVNNHLETVGFSMHEKKLFNQMVEGKKPKVKKKHFLSKLKKAQAKRAPQADAVARYIAEKGGDHIIVCGDFNDSPLSYVHHTIGRGLRDCFAEAGTGLGFTFQRYGMYVRIDNIFCSKSYEPYSCEVDRSITDSDHYPIFCWLKRRANP